MDQVKEAFSKVKKDIDSLQEEFGLLRQELTDTREKLIEISEILLKMNEKITSTHKEKVLMETQGSSTHNTQFKPLNSQNLPISTGNQGASTDRQTDRQTHQQTDNLPKNGEKKEKYSIDDAVEILDSLDNIKKELRLKFKKLTEQELLVFSTIYQLENESEEKIDHKTLSNKLKLSESSIRDYIGRIIKKGIPVDKKRMNNKTISLSISPNLKKIASLSTILKLRDL